MYGLRNLQEMKWSILYNEVKDINQFDLNVTAIVEKVDFKKPYSSWKYLSVENQSSSFIINSFSYFM